MTGKVGRNLQVEMQKCFKVVDDKVEAFCGMFLKFEAAKSTNQRNKLERDLKTEIKKLQRHRDNIKAWANTKEGRHDIEILNSYKRKIEEQMERFRKFEADFNLKTYSKKALEKEPRPKDHEKTEKWIRLFISQIKKLIEVCDNEIETLTQGKKRKGRYQHQDKIEELNDQLEGHRFHLDNLEKLLRALNDESVKPAEADAVKECVEYYIDQCEQGDFDGFDDAMYEDLPFGNEEVLTVAAAAALREDIRNDEVDNKEAGESDEMEEGNDDKSVDNKEAVKSDEVGDENGDKSVDNKEAVKSDKVVSSHEVNIPNSWIPLPSDVQQEKPMESAQSQNNVEHTSDIADQREQVRPFRNIQRTSTPQPRLPLPDKRTSTPQPRLPLTDNFDITQQEMNYIIGANQCRPQREGVVNHTPSTDSYPTLPEVVLDRRPLSKEQENCLSRLNRSFQEYPCTRYYQTDRFMCNDILSCQTDMLSCPGFDENSTYPQQALELNAELCDKFSNETLFFIFYRDFDCLKIRCMVSKALEKRKWIFHRGVNLWMARRSYPTTINNDFEIGVFEYYDFQANEMRIVENFKCEYRKLGSDYNTK